MSSIRGMRVAVVAAVLIGTFLRGVAEEASAPVAFTNVNVISMLEEGVQPDQVVVIRGDSIAAIGAEPPAGARIIDGQGGFLIPGLAEMVANVPDDADYRDDVFFLWLAHGVTFVRGMLGHPSHLELRQQLLGGEVLGPRLLTAGAAFGGRTISGPSASASMARRQKKAGYDFLKIHPGLSRDEYDILAFTAKDVGIPFGGHITERMGLAESLAAGQRWIDHLDGYLQALVPDLASYPREAASPFGMDLAPYVDRSLIEVVVAQTVESGAAVVPTETLLENFANAAQWLQMSRREQFRYVPEELRESYVRSLSGAAEASGANVAAEALTIRKELIKALHDAGVPVLLGSDSPQVFNVPGFSTHRELESMVAAGLTPFEALATATTAPATFFDTAAWGAIEPGRTADLVLLRANPLDDITNTRAVEGVMVRGRWLDRTELDAGLDAIEAKYR